MALKDWKRIKQRQKDVIEWGNFSEIIAISPNSSPTGATPDKKWSVWLSDAFVSPEYQSNDEELKKQLTKSEALKFVNEYIRTH